MKATTAAKKGLRGIVLHATLIAGSVLFAMPFIWLFSTSAKVNDEMYPPRWIPQVPPGVIESPYIALRENERPLRPVGVAEENWERVLQPVVDAVSARAQAIAPNLPDFFLPYLPAQPLAEGIVNRLVKRTPDALFTEPTPVVTEWFSARVDEETVREVFDTVYRRMAVADIVLHGRDVITVERPSEREGFNWRVVEGDAELVPRMSGLLRPAQEVHYSFDEQRRIVLQAVQPIEMPPDMLKKVAVSVHGDRSWHEVQAVVELDGRRFESAQAAFLGSDRWQDITWQFRSEDDDSIQMKTWLRMDPAGPSDFNEPGKVRVTLQALYANRLKATFNKYTNNYRNVLQKVPLFVYVRNSLFLVVLNVTGQIIGSSLVAFAFARLRWPGRETCFKLVIATMMIPAQVTMIPVFLIYKNIGWYNTLQPLWVGSFFGSAFYIFLLRQFMRGIPADLEDSAKIDGCGYFGIYWRIILPLVKPALATIGIFTFMATWNDFMGPLIYLSDQELYPLSLGLFALQVFQLTEFGLMMAASVLMTLPVILLFFAAQRQFIQGITLTGLKG